MKITQIIQESAETIDVNYWPSEYILKEIQVNNNEWFDITDKYLPQTDDLAVINIREENLNDIVKLLGFDTHPDWDKSAYNKRISGMQGLLLVYNNKTGEAELAVKHSIGEEHRVMISVRCPGHEWFRKQVEKRDKGNI